MSQKEVDRLSVIQQVQSKHMSQKNAAKILGLKTRTIRRLQRKLEREGPQGLASKRRGQPSNNHISEEIKSSALKVVKDHYPDFGPTFAREKLIENHHFIFSSETLRQWMISEGLWKGKRRKPIQTHPMRARRSQLGELIQIDGSPHDWFEARGPRCCLIVFIDDASSRLMALRFVEVESTEAYFATLDAYLKQHGRPVSFYSDRHSIFRVNIKEAATGTGVTQFGRALRELDIKLICANSPQAKGRVEKANRTLQDRLVKEMRLKGISDIHTANDFLPQYIEDYNRRFAVEPAASTDAHRPTLPDEEALKLILSQKHDRTISKNLEVSYDNVIYQIQLSTPGYTMRNAKLTVCDRKGEITLQYKGKTLMYKVFEKNNKPTKVLSSKEITAPQKEVKKSVKPGANHPWRRKSIKTRKQTESARQ